MEGLSVWPVWSVWSCLLQSVYAPRDGGDVSVVSVVVSAAVCVRAS